MWIDPEEEVLLAVEVRLELFQIYIPNKLLVGRAFGYNSHELFDEDGSVDNFAEDLFGMVFEVNKGEIGEEVLVDHVWLLFGELFVLFGLEIEDFVGRDVVDAEKSLELGDTETG